MFWFFIVLILIFLYFIFFATWLYFFHKALTEAKETRKKIFLIYVSVFMFFTYTLSFIVLRISS